MSFPLILITSPEDFAGEADLVQEMFEAGLERLHLRKPRADEGGFEKWLLAIPQEYHSRIAVHGQPAVARSLSLGGLHGLPQIIPTFRGAGLDDWQGTRSLSLHSLLELECLTEVWDYVFLGPVFDSISKMGYGSAFPGAEGQSSLRLGIREHHGKASAPQVFALGGVEQGTLPLLGQLGFDGAAVLGAVWNAPEPMRAFQELLEESKCVQPA